MDEKLQKAMDMLNSKDREMVILGATLLFSDELESHHRYSLPGTFEADSILSEAKPLSAHYNYARVTNEEHYDLLFRKGERILYKGWGYWIFQPLDSAPFKVRCYRTHIDLN